MSGVKEVATVRVEESNLAGLENLIKTRLENIIFLGDKLFQDAESSLNDRRNSLVANLNNKYRIGSQYSEITKLIHAEILNRSIASLVAVIQTAVAVPDLDNFTKIELIKIRVRDYQKECRDDETRSFNIPSGTNRMSNAFDIEELEARMKYSFGRNSSSPIEKVLYEIISAQIDINDFTQSHELPAPVSQLSEIKYWNTEEFPVNSGVKITRFGENKFKVVWEKSLISILEWHFQIAMDTCYARLEKHTISSRKTKWHKTWKEEIVYNENRVSNSRLGNNKMSRQETMADMPRPVIKAAIEAARRLTGITRNAFLNPEGTSTDARKFNLD